mgnify:CR=1 FL=1
MLEFILERANYWAIIGLMMIGLYITFASGNLIKRLVGLSLFQTSVCLFYVTLGKVAGGTAPILYGEDAIEHPHVLMLTAIVVGVATLSVGLALIVRIREAYGSIESDEVREIDLETALAQEAEIDQWLHEAGA